LFIYITIPFFSLRAQNVLNDEETFHDHLFNAVPLSQFAQLGVRMFSWTSLMQPILNCDDKGLDSNRQVTS